MINPCRWYFLKKGGRVLHFSNGPRKAAWCGVERTQSSIVMNRRAGYNPDIHDPFDLQRKCATCLHEEERAQKGRRK